MAQIAVTTIEVYAYDVYGRMIHFPGNSVFDESETLDAFKVAHELVGTIIDNDDYFIPSIVEDVEVHHVIKWYSGTPSHENFEEDNRSTIAEFHRVRVNLI